MGLSIRYFYTSNGFIRLPPKLLLVALHFNKIKY